VFESYGIFIEPDWDDFSKLLKVDIKDNKALTLSQSHLVLPVMPFFKKINGK
jgi:hypothetical protein